jgi:hypothetical protein
MKILNFELIVEKTPDALNRRVNEKIALGWELMFGCSGMNSELTRFAAWMVEPRPPVFPKKLEARADAGATAGS